MLHVMLLFCRSMLDSNITCLRKSSNNINSVFTKISMGGIYSVHSLYLNNCYFFRLSLNWEYNIIQSAHTRKQKLSLQSSPCIHTFNNIFIFLHRAVVTFKRNIIVRQRGAIELDESLLRFWFTLFDQVKITMHLQRNI